MEQRAGSKLRKEHVKSIYYHPDFLTYMQSIPYEMPGWISKLQGGVSITSDMQMTPPYGQKQRRTKEPLEESERVE